MNTLPIIEACWIICGVVLVLRMLGVGRTSYPKAGSVRRNEVPLASVPARPQSLDEIRARMQSARGQEKAALEDMALDIEANTIDEQGYADWLRSIGENDPDLWRG